MDIHRISVTRLSIIFMLGITTLLTQACKEEEIPTPTPDNTYVQDAYLKAANTGKSDKFGYSVATNGTYVVVGATAEASNSTTIINIDATADTNDSSSDAGAVYVYVKDATGDWYQDAYLKPANTSVSDKFGFSVAIGTNTIVVGAPYEKSLYSGIINTDASADTADSTSDVGAVYVFTRDATGDWIQDAYLKAANAKSGDKFGESVAIDGDIIVVGTSAESSNHKGVINTDSTADSDNSLDDSGAAYIFKKDSSGNWIQDAYLKASNSDKTDKFGCSVSISGEIVAVGAYMEHGGIAGIENTDGSATDYKVAGDGTAGPGAVYVFKKDSNGDWIQDAYLKASNLADGAYFGKQVSISGEVLVTGAPQESSNSSVIINTDNKAEYDSYRSQSGAAFVFARDSAGDWVQDAYLKASNCDLSDNFGWSVGISGDHIAVGAFYESSIDQVINNSDGEAEANTESCLNCNYQSGAAYLFKKDTAGDWIQDAYVKASNNDTNDQFGYSIAINGSLVAVGATLEDAADSTSDNTDGSASTDDSVASAGAVYLFKR